MRINWGYKIALLYSGFVILILSMVGLTMRERVDLVAKDYYEQELKYQEKIDKLNHTRSLRESLIWQVHQGTIILKFPSQFHGQRITGSVYFFSPSDATKDKTFQIDTDTMGIQNISTARLKKGQYKMQVSWETNIIKYFNEGIIQIN